MQTISLRFEGKRATKATSAGNHVKVEASNVIKDPKCNKVLALTGIKVLSVIPVFTLNVTIGRKLDKVAVTLTS